MKKVMGQKKICDLKKILGSKILWQNNFKPKKFWLHKNVGSKKIFPKKILAPKNYGSKKSWFQKILTPKNLAVQEILGSKKFWVKKNF